MRCPFRKIRRPLLLLGLAAGLPLAVAATISIYWSSLESSIRETATLDERTPADAIVIFGAAIADKGQPGTILRSRLDHALALYRAGLATNFILTGGVGWGPPAESVVMKRILAENGIPDACMAFETRSHSTREQVDFAVGTMKKSGWQRALLVSDPLHMYRLRQYFADSGLEIRLSPATGIRFNKNEYKEYLRAEIVKLFAWQLLGQ